MTVQTTWPNIEGVPATVRNVRPLPDRREESWRHFPLKQLKNQFRLGECPPTVSTLSGSPQIGSGAAWSSTEFAPLSDWTSDLAKACTETRSLALSDGDSVTLLFEEPTAAKSFVPTHFQVRVEAGAKVDLKLVFHSKSNSKSTFWRHTCLEILLEKKSQCQMTYTQVEPETAVHITQVAVIQKDHSILEAFCGGLGGHSARAEFVIQTGSDCQTDIKSLLIGEGTSHQGFGSIIQHIGTGSKSRQLVKNILQGTSTGSFHGAITIPKTGQRTDAQQLGRALLLGEAAQMASQPQLEIEADDVKCQHGAAISRLSPEELFYFRARGIDEETATGMLAQAFAFETLEGLAEGDQLAFFKTAMNKKLRIQ